MDRRLLCMMIVRSIVLDGYIGGGGVVLRAGTGTRILTAGLYCIVSYYRLDRQTQLVIYLYMLYIY
jgi:hypothetical protein